MVSVYGSYLLFGWDFEGLVPFIIRGWDFSYSGILKFLDMDILLNIPFGFV